MVVPVGAHCVICGKRLRGAYGAGPPRLQHGVADSFGVGPQPSWVAATSVVLAEDGVGFVWSHKLDTVDRHGRVPREHSLHPDLDVSGCEFSCLEFHIFYKL